jgi:hypothetical protein
MEVGASSSVVMWKLSPVPPTRVNSSTWVIIRTSYCPSTVVARSALSAGTVASAAFPSGRHATCNSTGNGGANSSSRS